MSPEGAPEPHASAPCKNLCKSLRAARAEWRERQRRRGTRRDERCPPQKPALLVHVRSTLPNFSALEVLLAAECVAAASSLLLADRCCCCISMAEKRRLLLLSGGVIVLHTLVTILEEALFAQPVFRAKAGSTFMTLTFYVMAAAAYAPRGGSGGGGNKQPRLSRRLTGMIAASAALYVTTTTLSKTALTYIDLPTQSILKSAKLLPVMVGSIVILGQRFTLREWLAAAMLVSGIAIFSASGSGQPRGAQSLRGGACLLVALVCDAALGNYQKRVLQQGCTVQQLMLYQSLAGMLAMGAACVASGTLLPGAALLISGEPVALMLLGWAAALTAGTALILRLVDEYSAVTAITVTTLRKAGTLAASFALFPKPLGLGHPIGAALVLCSALVKANISCRRRSMVEVALLAAAHAAAHRSRGPPACLGLSSGPENREPLPLGCRCGAAAASALAPAQSHRVHCL